jgi:uncharacterized protein
MKKLFKILLLTLTLCLTMATAWAAKAQEVADGAGVLTPVQKTKITQQIQQMYKKHQVRMAFVSINQESKVKPGEFANGLLDKIYNDGAKGNMVFLVNTKTRKWYVATDKKVKAMISDEYGIEELGKKIVPALKKNDYNAACENYLKGADELLTYYEKNGKPKAEEGTSPFLLLGGALLAGLLAAFGYGAYLKGTMNNVVPAAEASYYMVKDSFALENSLDIFLYTTFTRVAKAKAEKNTVTESSSDDDHGGGGGDY